MKKILIFPLAAGLVLGVVGIGSAHWEEGVVWPVAQFPDNAVPVVDGVLSDWDIVPAGYALGNEWFNDARGLVPEGWTHDDWDESDFSMRHMAGWNDSNNRFYLATRTFDDEHNMDRDAHWSEDDSWEISFWFDHAAYDAPEEGIAYNVRYNYSVPIHPTLGDFFWSRPFAQWEWLWPGTEWIEFAYTFDGEEFGESTYYYETSIRPIGQFANDENSGPGDMEVWDLEEGDIMHLGIVQIDNDQGNNYREPGCCGYWSTLDDCCAAVNDWILMEMDDELLANLSTTAVETDSWGRIKAQFK